MLKWHCFYLKKIKPFKKSNRLFIAYGERYQGEPISKQRLSHWIKRQILGNPVETVVLQMYSTRATAAPEHVWAHSYYADMQSSNMKFNAYFYQVLFLRLGILLWRPIWESAATVQDHFTPLLSKGHCLLVSSEWVCTPAFKKEWKFAHKELLIFKYCSYADLLAKSCENY